MKKNFPKRIPVGCVINFKVSAVCISSSLTNICERPDIAEKNIIIQSKADLISSLALNVPIENDTAIKVIRAKSNIALIAYRVLNSCRIGDKPPELLMASRHPHDCSSAVIE